MDRIKLFQKFKNRVIDEQKNPVTRRELKILLSLPVSPEFILYLNEALEKKLIPPDELLVQAIPNSKTKDSLIYVSMALRYNANPNLYINIPKIGLGHILLYTEIQNIPNQTVSEMIILLLHLSGSTGVLPAFTITNTEDIVTNKFNKISVIEWLNKNGYETIIPIVEANRNKIKRDVLDELAVLLDRPKLFYEQRIKESEFRLVKSTRGRVTSNDPLVGYINIIPINIDNIIKYRSEKILGEIIKKVKEPVLGLRPSLFNINFKAYRLFIDSGALPMYAFMNNIILSLNKYKKENDPLAFDQVKEMLLYSIDVGVILDLQQLNAIKKADPSLEIPVKERYEIPYWKKTCSNLKTGISDRLIFLAKNLNLDVTGDKKDLCDKLSKLTKDGLSQLTEKGILRQQRRIAKDVGKEDVTDLNMICQNKILLPINPYELNDLNLVYYKDKTDMVWCFSSDMFEKLLKTKINPYTMLLLPESVLNDIRFKQLVLKKLYRPSFTYNEAVKKLLSKDKITNDESIRIENIFYEYIRINGINKKDVIALNRIEKENIFKRLGLTVNLKKITKKHANTTFAITSYNIIRIRPNMINRLLLEIRNEIINSKNIRTLQQRRIVTRSQVIPVMIRYN